MNITSDTPAKNLRVARCMKGHGYFAWPGSVDIGCLVCGGQLATTTRQQRQQPWRVLDSAEAAQASRLDGGIPSSIRWERDKLDSSLTRVAEELLTELGDEDRLEIAEEGARWADPGDRVIWRRHSGHNLDGSLRQADKTIAKIARLQRKLDKLGGPTEPRS